jgi:hypothetical protein
MRRRERTQMLSRNVHSAKPQRATSENINCALLANKHSIAVQIAKSTIGRRLTSSSARNYKIICLRQNDSRVVSWYSLLLLYANKSYSLFISINLYF